MKWASTIPSGGAGNRPSGTSDALGLTLRLGRSAADATTNVVSFPLNTPLALDRGVYKRRAPIHRPRPHTRRRCQTWPITPVAMGRPSPCGDRGPVPEKNASFICAFHGASSGYPEHALCIHPVYPVHRRRKRSTTPGLWSPIPRPEPSVGSVPAVRLDLVYPNRTSCHAHSATCGRDRKHGEGSVLV